MLMRLEQKLEEIVVEEEDEEVAKNKARVVNKMLADAMERIEHPQARCEMCNN